MTDFERVSDEVNGDFNMDSVNECAIEWVRGKKTATFMFANNTRHKGKVLKLAEEYPEQVQIRHTNPDGSIVGTIDLKFIKIGAPRKVSDEQKDAMAKRIKKYWDNKNTLQE